MTTQLFKNTLHGIAELSPGYNFGISQTKFITCSAFIWRTAGYCVDTKYLSVCV